MGETVIQISIYQTQVVGSLGQKAGMKTSTRKVYNARKKYLMYFHILLCNTIIRNKSHTRLDRELSKLVSILVRSLWLPLSVQSKELPTQFQLG